MNRFALTALILLSVFSSLLLADTKAKPSIEVLLHSQISAIASNDYQQFLEHTDSNFRKAISAEQFEILSRSLSSRFKGGYQPEYLGVLNQEGFKVHLWKVVSSSSESDSLIKMAMGQNQIAGFWIE